MTRTTSDLLGRDEERQPGKNNKETCGVVLQYKSEEFNRTGHSWVVGQNSQGLSAWDTSSRPKLAKIAEKLGLH